MHHCFFLLALTLIRDEPAPSPPFGPLIAGPIVQSSLPERPSSAVKNRFSSELTNLRGSLLEGPLYMSASRTAFEFLVVKSFDHNSHPRSPSLAAK